MSLRPLLLAVASPILVLVCAACPPDAPGDDGGDPVVDVDLGGVVLEQDRAPLWQASASFAAPLANDACESEDIAGCTLTTCDPGAGDAAPAAPPPDLDAGAVSVQSPTTTTTLVRDAADGRYALQRVEGEKFFENGVELEAIAGGGDDVEGFVLTMNAPTPLQMVTPPLASVTVKVTEALETEWSGSSQGNLRFTLRDNVGRLSVTCTAPASQGAFAIPAEAVGRFPVGEALGQLSVVGEVSASAALASSRFVSFTTRTPATAAAGGNANYFVTFAAP